MPRHGDGRRHANAGRSPATPQTAPNDPKLTLILGDEVEWWAATGKTRRWLTAHGMYERLARPWMLTDLESWALSVPIASTKQISSARARLVLLVLCDHVNNRGIAWPSVKTIAERLQELAPRDVRNAFDALEASGVISRAGNQAARQAVHWRIAGYPANPTRDSPRSDYAGNIAGLFAGHYAGNIAGDYAGYPATNGIEEKGSARAREDAPAPPPPPRPPCTKCFGPPAYWSANPDTPNSHCPDCWPARTA